jgi:hypothetical protein
MRPGQGSNGRDVLEEVKDLVNRIEALVGELRQVVDDEDGGQT